MEAIIIAGDREKAIERAASFGYLVLAIQFKPAPESERDLYRSYWAIVEPL